MFKKKDILKLIGKDYSTSVFFSDHYYMTVDLKGNVIPDTHHSNFWYSSGYGKFGGQYYGVQYHNNGKKSIHNDTSLKMMPFTFIKMNKIQDLIVSIRRHIKDGNNVYIYSNDEYVICEQEPRKNKYTFYFLLISDKQLARKYKLKSILK